MPKSARVAILAAAGLLSSLALVGCGSSITGTEDKTGSGGSKANAAPTVNVSASASAALVGLTKLTFTATATDPDGDAVTYAWDLGDGTTASGPSVQKTYDRAGTYLVVVKVSDARGASTSASATITVKSLDGFWNDKDQGYGIEITQSGTTFTGRTVFGIRDLTGALKGTITADLDAHYRTSYFAGAFTDDFVGKLDGSLDAFTGTLDLSDGRSHFQFHMNMVRQK